MENKPRFNMFVSHSEGSLREAKNARLLYKLVLNYLAAKKITIFIDFLVLNVDYACTRLLR